MKPPPWKTLSKTALLIAPGFLLGFIVAHGWFRGYDFTRWARVGEALGPLRWYVVLCAAALAGVIWLALNLFDARRRQRYSVLTLCLLASVLAHVAGLFGLSSWVLSRAVYEAAVEKREEEPEIAVIGEDALAQEKLALSIREQVASIPAPPPEMIAQAVDRQPLPPLEMLRPAAPPPSRWAPAARAEAFPLQAIPTPLPVRPVETLPPLATRPSLPAMVMAPAMIPRELPQTVAAARTPDPKPAPPEVPVVAKTVPELLSQPPALVLPPPATRPAARQPLPGLAPAESMASLKNAQKDPIARAVIPATLPPLNFGMAPVTRETAPQPAMNKAPEPKAVVSSLKLAPRPAESLPGTVASNAQPLPAPSIRALPALPALGKMELPALPSSPAGQAPAKAAAPELMARAVVSALPARLIPGPDLKLEARPQSSAALALRDPALRTEQVVKQLGGSKETEEAINRALAWFKQDQEADGRWSMSKHQGENKHVVACTSLVMLSYMGWGATHAKDGPHRPQMERAMAWLLAMVKPDGDLRDKGDMYDQGIGAIALTEAYGLTKDEKLRGPAQKAVDFIVKAQSKTHGGWRYVPGAGDGDTSVFGWQLMALKSGQLAGLSVPEEAFALSKRWLDQVGGGQHGGLYGYRDKSPRPPMAVEGMFAQQLLGLGQTDPRMEETAQYVKSQMPEASKPDFYYWYYGCLALYQHQGPVWEEWNQRMQAILLPSQIREGKDNGSWKPGGEFGARSGRAVTTALATLSLEVYYRYLPLYGLKPGVPQ